MAEHTVMVNRRGKEIAIQDSAAPIRGQRGNLMAAYGVSRCEQKSVAAWALHYGKARCASQD